MREKREGKGKKKRGRKGLKKEINRKVSRV